MIESIDSLLVILNTQRGKELRFEVGQKAKLVTASQEYEISPDPLSQIDIGNTIGPIVPETLRRQLPSQPEAEFNYDCGDAGVFKVSITKPQGSLCVTLRPAVNGGYEPLPVSWPSQQAAATQTRSVAEPAPSAPQTYVPPPPTVAQRPQPASSGHTGSLPKNGASAQPSAAPAPAAATSVPAAVNEAQSMEALFKEMFSAGASDLHISVSLPPMVRKDGQMMPLNGRTGPLTPDEARRLLTSIMPVKSLEEFDRRNDTDFAYDLPGIARFRANVFMDRKGMGGVFRVIPNDILTAEQLRLSQSILNLCKLNKGLVLVTGPTGSGKSTTLCALIDYINRNRDDHIITIEDPIEFVHENKRCVINQREVHNHTESFKGALRAALREDPDIILVGEMRDLETVAIAIETAETGHLVFGTLHTTTAASTVDRIIDQFPADRQTQIRIMLSESLRGVISQTLLRKRSGGRVAALEVLIVTPAISNLIREAKTFQIPSSMQTGRALGMVTLNDSLLDLVKSGVVAADEAYKKSVDKSGFEALLKRNGITFNPNSAE
jgi:twitching motility protein PilT